MLLKLKKFVNPCLRRGKPQIYSGKLREYIPKEVSARRKNMQEPACARKNL
jgi:hypothetical protein